MQQEFPNVNLLIRTSTFQGAPNRGRPEQLRENLILACGRLSVHDHIIPIDLRTKGKGPYGSKGSITRDSFDNLF